MSALSTVAERPVFRSARPHCDSQERRRAAAVQRSFLPTLPAESGSGFKMTGYFEPVDELGGDFYDLFYLDDGRIAFYLADVSGHDFAAALVTVWLRQLLHGMHAHHPDLLLSPARVFESLQESMVSDHLETTFLTMAYVVLDPGTGELCYATAGHPAPLLLRDQSVQQVAEANGPILSAEFGPEIGWIENTIFLEPGDGLILFSDGVVEANDWEGQPVGLFGLQEAALEAFSADHSAKAIGNAVQRMTGHHSAEDDMTLLLLTVPNKGD